MNKALIVLDVQYGITSLRDVKVQVDKIEAVIADFEQWNEPIIYMKHVDYIHEGSSLFYKNAAGLEIAVDTGRHPVLEKSKPSAFSNPKLKTWLHEHQVEQVFIVGFNTEYCCLFTAITAEHEGFKVTLIEDATGTVNTADTYEMPGLDIQDFVGSILNWSNCIEVLYVEEYKVMYRI
ncbi:isochorismatase family protein [Paenibacillus xylanilyticus]|uniref:Isochorismatase family protein n=1 Tax=Paenibacillus xylanilyticus TaxID=248903 RepID=A0A7Y6EWT8_9BACL|nr:isochorismatase family protein [Paenibacillus xylanilyticus]NUU78131.1 isochorismatase family protein [Paenibacillus xylanilyticus]